MGPMLRNLKAAALGALALLGLLSVGAPALAQNTLWNPGCGVIGVGGCTLPVGGSFSATLSGYAPAGVYANIASVTTTSSNVALPAGQTVVVYNTGTSAVAVKLGTTSGVTASWTAGDVIQPGSTLPLVVGSNTYLAAITSSGTSSLVLSGGSGLWAGSGGGGGGGGGGGAVTIADGADVSFGQKTDAQGCGYTGTQSVSFMCQMQALVNAVLNGSTPSGTNHIGNVDGAETQNSPVTGGLFRQGCRASTTSPTVVVDGSAVDPMCSVDGKQIVKPFAPAPFDQVGQVTASSNTSFTSVGSSWATPAAGQYAIVTGYNCERTDSGTTAAYLIFQNVTASGVSIIPLPPNYGGAAKALATPWKVYAAATLPAVETSAAGVTAICSLEGYNGNGN